jgi:hypothetical protein
MNTSFTLKPNNNTFSITDHFPDLSKDKKMGIFLSGGMESTLLLLIAQMVYGKDKVLAFYSDNIFSANDPVRGGYIIANVMRTAEFCNIDPIFVNFDYDLHLTNRQKSHEDKITYLQENYAVEFVMLGFTKLFFEVEIFKQDGITEEEVKKIAFSDPVKYKSTIEEFYLETGDYTWTLLEIDIPEDVYPTLRSTSGFIRSPFQNLNKCEVVDLYRQLEKLDILYKTSSCITESLTKVGKHCGRCFNCQQRYDAFRILNDNVEDLTEYDSDEIKKRRQNLENIMQEKKDF